MPHRENALIIPGLRPQMGRSAPMIVEAYGRSETFLTSGGKAEALSNSFLRVPRFRRCSRAGRMPAPHGRISTSAGPR